MRWILLVPVLLLTVGAQTLEAQGVMDLPDKAAVEQFGDNQLLEFRPNPDGSSRDYLVYGLTRKGATPGVELRPLRGNTPVATAVQQVTLYTDSTQTATVNYQLEQVAYLRVQFTVSVQDGTLTREQNGQETTIASVNPGINVTFAWGLGWVATFGLIGIFAYPNASTELVHDEVVPLNASPITFTVGGGGGCLAFSGAHDKITVYPSQLQAGHLYELVTGLNCGGLFQGNQGYVGQRVYKLVGFRVFIDGQLVPDPFVGRLDANLDPRYRSIMAFALHPFAPLYWNVPDPNYTRRVGLINGGLYPTKSVPIQPSVPVQFSYNAMYRGPGNSSGRDDYHQGFDPELYAEHPELGRVLIGNYAPTLTFAPKLQLYRVLEGPAGNLAGNPSRPFPLDASIQLDDMSFPVTSIRWDSVATAGPNGTTVTRRVPVYSLGPSPTTIYDLPDLRLQTLGDCERRQDWRDGTFYYTCNVGGDQYEFRP